MNRATWTSTNQQARPAMHAGGLICCAVVAWMAIGCQARRPDYGRESVSWLPKDAPQSIAVAPALNLSGQRGPDPLLQADLVYQELQQVRGLTVVPVNRTVQVMVGLELNRIDTMEQAYAVCDALGVQGLIVPTITAYDPYDPPKFGASVQLFVRERGGRPATNLDVHQLSRQATAGSVESLPQNADFIQAVQMFDAAAGSTRDRVERYAAGRTDPTGPLGVREYYLSMDRYAAFAWHELIDEVFEQLR